MSRVTTYDVVDMSEYYQAICKHEKQNKQITLYSILDLLPFKQFFLWSGTGL